ncbi:hypothetical protein [Streptomyces sp. NPDC090025]|uniref:hypothetical protein n=1 Tax=Streptomyces sp. NPDC090025 TaxID=3365922 RepID=UPI003832AC55
MGRLSPAQLRGLGLGAAVLIAVLVPIAATAGPAGRAGDASAGDDAKANGPKGPKGPNGPTGSGSGAAGGLLPGLGPVLGARPAGDASRARDAGAGTAAERPPLATRCGPELASPDGVEAQTCVVTEGAATWARTYYRNATGQELDAVLTLMAPGGRTVQVRCRVEARDEPGTCETPKEPSRGAADGSTAVAEFAGAGEGGNAPLLLRAGSNAPEPAGS